ncbi:tetratricopeptide repeat protein [Coleofasciculus sp. E1-EBD-02]|uniref:tetratricopeptide repeat protein n=1 Tax=Coleofasciculus sp. E1-EBD-02 TaxID=3068481 RepID=UPI0032F55FF6
METDYNLIDRLKAIKPLLINPDTSVIERYAGISELALFKNWRKVSLLTLGLFDANAQVRELAADVLEQTYDMGKSSRALLILLENECEELRNTVHGQDKDKFLALLDTMRPLLRKKGHHVDGEFVDCYCKHVLIILKELGKKARQFQDEDSKIHPLRPLLQDEENRWILKLIRECLYSEEIYCRRDAILAIGELGLEFDLHDKSPFDLICEVIDRPENRNDRNVTWDGVKALTSLSQQNPDYLERLYKVIRNFYNNRQYSTDDGRAEEYRFHTRGHCIEAFAELIEYENSSTLIKKLNELIEDGKQKKFLDIMGFYQQETRQTTNAYSAVKRTFVKILLKIYQHENSSSNNQSTRNQHEILNIISTWVRSKDSSLRATAISFFGNLPDLCQAIDYLLKNADRNNKDIVEDNRHQQELNHLLAERKEIITVLGTVLSQAIEKESAPFKEEALKFYQLLWTWSYPIKDGNEKELKAADDVRLLALWTLYNLSAKTTDIPSLPQSDIDTLLSSEQEPSFRSVLELFRARNSGERFSEQLRLIVQSNDDQLIRACARIELLIQAKEQNTLSDEEDLSEAEVNYIHRKIRQIKIGQLTEIPYSLAERFMPVLAEMNQSNATQLIGNLLRDNKFPKVQLGIQLREAISGYHCYQLREVILMLLLEELDKQYKKSKFLRLNYLNLLRAGEYSKQQEQSASLEIPVLEISAFDQQEQEFKNRVLKGLQDIAKKFETLELPVIFNQKRRVAALESMFFSSVNTVHTVLYASDGREKEEATVNVYLKSQTFPNSWIFLDKAMADTEIAKLIRSRLKKTEPQKLSDHQLRFTNIRNSLVARVEAIADDGVILDIGLCRYKPKVRFDAMSSLDKRNNYTRLRGVLLPFEILSITFDTSNGADEIVDLTLSRTGKDFENEFAEDIIGKTVQAQIVAVSDENESETGVIFRVKETEKDVLVPLKELSWLSDSPWGSSDWRTEFEEKRDRGETLEITYSGQYWSLRDNSPKTDNFIKLLYDQGTEEFDLVYSEKRDEGYVFEIEPGRNCYVPAERLLNNDQNFFLPSKEISSGDILGVKFVRSEIDRQKEVFLKVVDCIPNEWGKNEGGEARVYKGMRIVGSLLEINNGTGKLKPSVPEYLKDSECLFTIRNLPVDHLAAGIKNGSLVSGKINTIDKKRQEITLIYDAVAMPSQLEWGQSYPCLIEDNPKLEDYSLKLRYGNVRGELRESYMTYSHEPLLFDESKGKSNYSKGASLMVHLTKPVQWKKVYDEIVTVKQPEQTLSNLKIEGKNPTNGDVVSFTNPNVSFERCDRQRFSFSLDEFTFKGNPPIIYEGDRLELLKHSEDSIHLTLERAARAKFTILPNLDRRKEWPKWKTVLQPGKPYKCVYINIDFQTRNYLFEVSLGRVFALPLSCVSPATSWILNDDMEWRLTNQTTVEVRQRGENNFKSYQLHTGDFLTLYRPQSRNSKSESVVELHKFEPSPLHFAAEPWKFAGASWDFGVSQDDKPIPIIAKVTDIPSQVGIYLELASVSSPDEEIRLRSGIIGVYSRDKMSLPDKQRFDRCEFRRGDEVKVILSQPPEINKKGRLDLALKGAKYSETSQQTITEKLRELQGQIQTNFSQPKEGTIVRYDRKRHAFLVTLKEFSQCQCWLSDDEVSFSLVRNYQYLRAFGDDIPSVFTVLRVNIDTLELELSLKNNPKNNIDEAGLELRWSHGDLLKGATFIGMLNKIESSSLETELLPQSAADSEENSWIESSVNSEFNCSEIVAIEIKPGIIVDLPVERFLVHGTTYNSEDKNIRLQPGDQIALRVIEQDEGCYSLDVVRLLPAQINRLSNPSRVVYAEIKQTGDEVGIKIQGYDKIYEKYQCLIDPQFQQKLDQLRNPDLFRFIRRDNKTIYFEPLELRELKKGDLLRVTYKETTENGIRVLFGKNHKGFIYKSEISHRVDFALSEFNAEPDDSFEAKINRDVTDAKDVKFTLKVGVNQGFDYFLDSRVQEKLVNQGLNAVLFRQGQKKDYIDIEVKPGRVIRVYYDKIQVAPNLNKTKQQLKDELTPGDELQFKLLKQQNQIYLQLIDIIKSLSSYLDKGMVVLARYEERTSSSHQWIFSLPEYAPRKGRMKGELQNPFDQNLRLAVESIPSDPSSLVNLRLPSTERREFVLRVENISGDRIQVQNQDGQHDFLYSSEATYRINNHINYLQKQLPVGEVIVGNKNGEQLSLRHNKPTPFTFLRRYLQTSSKSSQELELTYVCSQGDDRIFEIKPGLSISIPATKLYFYDLPCQDFQRFFHGDVFTVRIERSSEEIEDKFRVVIYKINLSIFHDLQPHQFIEAQVQEIVDGKGIVVKAKHLELEQFIRKQNLLEKSTNPYIECDNIWLKVDYINRENYYIRLMEVNRPSLDTLKVDTGIGKQGQSFIIYGKISQRLENKIKLDVVGNSIEVWLSHLVWFDDTKNTTVDEVLLPDEQGLWVSVFTKGDELRANPKSIRSSKVSKQLEEGKIVQAQVLQINQDKQGNPKSVLLDVDGVRTLVENTDIAWGVPNNLPSVEPGTWLAVKILKSESNRYEPKKQSFLVSCRAVSSFLDELSTGKCFNANVRYTLPHGLVFGYQGALGYISNEELAWSRNTKAQEMLASGEQITVYKVADCDRLSPFSLKHKSQIEDWKRGDEVEAIVHRQTETGVYIRVKSLWAFVPSYQLGSEELAALLEKKKIVLRLEDVAVQQMRISFRPVGEEGSRPNATQTSPEKIRQTLDICYMTSFNRLSLMLQERSPKIVKLLAEDYLKLGNQCRKENPLEALEAYTQALEIAPNYSQVFYNQGELQRELAQDGKEEIEKAISSYTKALDINEEWGDTSPDNAYYSRGLAYAKIGNHQSAIDDFNQTIAQNPNYTDAYYNRGRTHFKIGNYQAAIEDISRTLSQNYNYPDAHFIQGMAHVKLGNHQAAIDNFNQTIDQNPNNGNAYYYRGIAHFQLDNSQAAIEDFNQTLTQKPKYTYAYYYRGMTHLQLDNPQIAIEDFNQALRQNRQYPEAYYGRGVANFQLKNYQAAIEDFNRAIQLKPDYTKAYNKRGAARCQQKDYQGAISDFERAIQLKPDYAAHNNCGKVRSQLQDYQGAISDFERAIQLKPDYAEAYECRGGVRSQLQNTQAALADFYQALEIFTQQRKIDDCQRVLNKIKKLEQ